MFKESNKKYHRLNGNLIVFLFVFALSILFFSCKQKPLPNQGMIDLLKAAEKDYQSPENVFSPESVVKYADSIINHSSDEEVITKALNNKANALLELGEEQKAIDILQNLLGKTKGNLDERQSILKDMAISYLRLGERLNCINMHNAASCIYPISIEGVHQDKNPSEKAIEIYKALLFDNPGDLESRWLLNIACLLYTSPSPRDRQKSRMPSSA